MKKEKQVRSYKRRTKSGKTVTVKAHTAKYEAADKKAKEVSKKEGAGKELEEHKKKPVQLEIPFDKEEEKKVLDEVKETTKKESAEKKPSEKKTTKKVRPVGSGTNGPTPKKKSEEKASKTADSKSTSSEPAFTAAEFKEWYRGTGSAADKKVAKALRAQLGRSGYRKLEDEAIDNYTSRGHLSMFKRVSGEGKSSTSIKTTKSSVKTKEPKKSVQAPTDIFERAELIRALKSKGKGQFNRVKMSEKYGDYFAKGSWNPSALGKALLAEDRNSNLGIKASKKFDKIVKEKSTGSKGTKAVKDIENLKSNWAAAKPVQIDKNTWRPSNFRNDTSGAYDMVSKEATERLIASQIKKAKKSKSGVRKNSGRTS